MEKLNFESRIAKLTKEFNIAINSKVYTYEETRKLEKCGIYIVYDNFEKIIYVGKTGRNGKTRLRELAADYRSHTLNRKLLRNLLAKTLKKSDLKLMNKTKKQLIADGEISEEEFKSLQKEINKAIRTKHKFQFYEVEQERLPAVEYFFIAVINPKHND